MVIQRRHKVRLDPALKQRFEHRLDRDDHGSLSDRLDHLRAVCQVALPAMVPLRSRIAVDPLHESLSLRDPRIARVSAVCSSGYYGASLPACASTIVTRCVRVALTIIDEASWRKQRLRSVFQSLLGCGGCEHDLDTSRQMNTSAFRSMSCVRVPRGRSLQLCLKQKMRI